MKKIELKDYIHLYKGGKVLHQGEAYTIDGVVPSEMPEDKGRLLVIASNVYLQYQELYVEDCKLILTEIGDMTEDQIKVCAFLFGVTMFKFYLENSIDCFNLIDAGVAVHKKDLIEPESPHIFTKYEAEEMMKAGEKMTHKIFPPGEYIYQKNGVIYNDEDILQHDFWAFRTSKEWQGNWAVYKEAKQNG